MYDEYVKWEYFAPVGETQQADEQLEEIWRLRGRVFFDQTQSSPTQIHDRDHLDYYSYHVLARYQGELIGCLRFFRLDQAPTASCISIELVVK